LARERIDHKEKKESTLKWFIIGIIPIVDLYLFWRVADLISGHEKVYEKYESITHKKAKDSNTLWFILFLIPLLLGLIMIPIARHYRAIYLLDIVTIPIGLYLLWKMAEIVSGHGKIFEKYAVEVLVHKDKKDSTLLWFVIGIIPLVDLYFLWKVAEAVSGHEKIYK
jgi:predicted nucleic acid-binding Zn ribbon protein